MGRKNRNKKTNQANSASTSGEDRKQMSKAMKKEVMDHVKSLLDKCSQQGNTGAKEFDDHLEIRELVEKIRLLQKDLSLVNERKEGSFRTFMEWLKSNKVDTETVDIQQFDGYGFGLKAAKDVKEEEKILAIPRNLMMTPETAKETQLGPLMAEDRILQVMPSVVLALHLLCERRAAETRWKPYIDILPETYTTPLYFTPEELKNLKGSPALSDCFNQYRNIARQYAYFYRLFETDPVAVNLNLKDCFTFDDYRWAVSTVMTRQNQIPLSDGGQKTFALIPLWDMCNHCNGLITTDFSLEQDCCECYSLRNYKKGDQIFIFYGARSNAELLVNNGFVYKENEHDRMAIKLGISKSDPLFNLKSEMLTKCGLQPARTFYLHTGEFPVDTDLLTFLRVFSMDEGSGTDSTVVGSFSGNYLAAHMAILTPDLQAPVSLTLLKSLKGKYSGMSQEELKEELGDLDKVVSPENESKVWSYLETRASLLSKAYETSAEEDEKLLAEGKFSATEATCVQLRLCEKYILKSTVAFSADKKHKCQPEQT